MIFFFNLLFTIFNWTIKFFFYLDIYIPFLFVIYGPFGPLFGLLYPFSFMTSISKSFFYIGFNQDFVIFTHYSSIFFSIAV